MSTSQYIYSILMDNAQTLGQDKLVLAWTTYNLYKQNNNLAETPCQVLL